MTSNIKKIGIAKVEFEKQNKNIYYPKTISLLDIEESLTVERFVLNYPEITNKTKRNTQSTTTQLDDNDCDTVRFGNIEVELKNDFLGAYLQKFTHLIVNSSLEKSFLAEFATDSTTIVHLT